jgi:hypothetical protein
MLAGVVALTTMAGFARADETGKACAARFEKAQYLQKDGKLRDARVESLACGAAPCPGFMREACQKLLSDIDLAQPTLVLGAQDAAGADLVEVRVTLDDQPFLPRLGADAVPVDPGEHTFRFFVADRPAATQHALVRTGEKNRVVRVTIPLPPPAPPQPAGPAATAPEGKSGGLVLPIVVGAVGVATIAASLGVGVSAKSDLDGLRSSCAPHCSASDVSSVNTRGAVSDVLLGLGVTGVAVAAVLFFVRRGGHEAPPVALRLVPATGGVGFSF